MSSEKRAGRRSPAMPLLMLLGCLFLWVSQLTFDAGDWPSTDRYPHAEITVNACGRVGAFVAYHLRRVIGDGVYPLILFSTAAVVLWLAHGHIVHLTQRVFGLTLLVACTSASAHLIAQPGPNALHFGNGGIVGAATATFLTETFAGVGSVLVLGYCLFVGLLFTAEGWMLRLSGVLRRAAHASGEAIISARALLPAPAPAAVSSSAAGRSVESAPTGGDVIDSTPFEGPKLRFHGDRETARKPRRATDESQRTLFDPVADQPRRDVEPVHAGTDGGTHIVASVPAVVDPPVEAARKTTVVAAAPDDDEEEDRFAALEAYPRRLDAWDFPPITMLDNPEYSFTAAQESVLRAKAKTLERTLQEFRLDARVVEIDTGPVITLFELSLGAGIKVSQISALANDIARALRAPSVRIIAPIPGKNTVGVEVPNPEKETVRLKGLILSTADRIDKMAIPLFLGKDASGTPLVVDLATMPHMLIAGTTGSGKSVALNAIIMSILMCRRPDMVKLVLIDPKMVELSQFKDVPHLMAPIITDMQRAEQILEWAVMKMDERYALIAEARVRNITGYNKLSEPELVERLEPTTEHEWAQVPKQLPHIVIVIDELADLMMTSAKEVEHHLSRLAQKSRAVGIHIIVATQRPEAKVVTGLIKSNLPCRCAFRVASRMDSRIVLDQNGAEVLLGQGDMLFLPPGSHKLRRAQGTFVTDEELGRVLTFLGRKATPEFHPELLRMRAKGAANLEDRDPLFDEAVEIVLDSNRGSVSLLQRRLTIGYSRASRLIEQMAAAGIVGDYKGSQAREVEITRQEWERMRSEQPPSQTGGGRKPSQRGTTASDFDDEDDWPDEYDDDAPTNGDNAPDPDDEDGEDDEDEPRRA